MAQYRNVKEFTDKIRNVYQKYREEYTALGNAILKDKKEWGEELRRGWQTFKEQQEATAQHDESAKKLRIAFESVEKKASAEFNKIKQECVEIFEPYNRATASMIDMPTLELLKSGILKNDELIDLANNFTDNITMLRLIGKYAEERATTGTTTDKELKSFALGCKEASFPYIKPIDDIILWSTKAIRADENQKDKEQTFWLANGIAKTYEDIADKITAEAEKFYISVKE